MDADAPTPEDLAAQQARREADQTELAAQTDLDAEEHAAQRRADKAAYLRDRLEAQRDADADR